MSKWSEIYQKEIENAGGDQSYLRRKVCLYRPLLKHIIKYALPGGQILEAGCGTAVLSTYLSSLGFSVVALDIDRDMLMLAERLAESYSPRPHFIQADLFSMNFQKGYFDIAFSHGTLEHFTDNEIITLINKQLEVAKKVIISIPSNYYQEKDRMYGDERFLSEMEWEKILIKSQGRIIERFAYYFYSPLQRLRYFLFKTSAPYIAFVMTNKDLEI